MIALPLTAGREDLIAAVRRAGGGSATSAEALVDEALAGLRRAGLAAKAVGLGLAALDVRATWWGPAGRGGSTILSVSASGYEIVVGIPSEHVGRGQIWLVLPPVGVARG